MIQITITTQILNYKVSINVIYDVDWNMLYVGS